MILADHLDATLAMAEDLSRLKVEATEDGTSTALIVLAQQARALELAIMARLIQARKRAQALVATHEDLKRLISSFVGGTAVVADAVAAGGPGFGDIHALSISSTSTALRFLQSRGIAAGDKTVTDEIKSLEIGEDYLAAELIHLGTMMDMVASFLDALDVAFELYSPAKGADHS